MFYSNIVDMNLNRYNKNYNKNCVRIKKKIKIKNLSKYYENIF